MPRFLWLVALACSLAFFAVMLSLRGERAFAVPEPHAMPVSPSEPTVGFALAATSSDSRTERAPIPVQATGTPPLENSAPEVGRLDIRTSEVRTGRADAEFFGSVTVHVVRDEDGQPLGDAEVEIQPPTLEAPRKVRTDSAGIANFENIWIGISLLTVTAPGRAPVTQAARLVDRDSATLVQVRIPIRRDFDVRLLDGLGRPFRAEDWHLSREHAALLGISVSGTCGIVGRAFEARDAPTHTARSTEHTSGPFTWRVELRGGGDVCVHAVLGATTVGATQVPPDATEVAIRVDASTFDLCLTPVVVRVLEESNDAPIVDADVEFRGGVSRPLELVTDPSGLVRARLALSGAVPVSVSAAGRVTQLVHIQNPPPAETVVRLSVGRRLSGRVVDQNGEPLAGVRIQLRDKRASTGSPTTSTAADGTFVLEGLAAAEFVVLADKLNSSGGAAVRGTGEVDCRASDAAGVEIRIVLAER